MSDAITAYAKALKPSQKAICAALRKAIDAALPKATSKIWHASPVWFIGENPVVGYYKKPTGVALLFWNGQSFDEPVLEPLGSFHAAQTKYENAADIDTKLLARWLKKAKTDIWDSAGLRKKMMAKKRGAQ